MLNNIGGLYLVEGKFNAALPIYERTLKISEQRYGEEHSFVADNLNNLTNLYY